MFENPRRGRQARNFTTNAPKILDVKSSSEQIFSRKLPLGAPENKVIFTHPTECRRVWLRGLGDWLNSSPYSWIFNLLCVSGFQASLLFTFFHAVTYGTKPITYVCFTFEIGAAQPRFITDFAPPQRFFCVNRSRLWYDFHGGVEAVRYQSMNIASSKS